MRKIVFLFALLALTSVANATPPTVEKGTVGCACNTSTVTSCLNVNTSRHYLGIQDQGANPAYVSVNNTPTSTTGTGMYLAGGTPGNFWEPSPGYVPSMTGGVPTGTVSCLSTGGNTVLSITAY